MDVLGISKIIVNSDSEDSNLNYDDDPNND